MSKLARPTILSVLYAHISNRRVEPNITLRHSRVEGDVRNSE